MTVRVWSAFTFLGSTAMLGIGAWLRPDLHGTGTHQQLGLPPCGMLEMTGVPCPMCGCTTAVTYFVYGQLLASFLTQPFGFLVALVAILLVPLTFVGMIKGTWKGPSMFTLEWYWRELVFGGMGFFAAAWVYKIILVRAGVAF